MAVPTKTWGHCNYKNCHGAHKIANQRIRGCKTKMRCEECSKMKGRDVWLCNKTAKVNGTYKPSLCHTKYQKKHFKSVGIASDSDSD